MLMPARQSPKCWKAALPSSSWQTLGKFRKRRRQPLRDFINRGRVLIAFAGPRLAAAEGDEFLPVKLRQGERALGGSMSWTEPQPVGEFSKSGPFAALNPPRDVTVTRQVLAEPDAELAARIGQA